MVTTSAILTIGFLNYCLGSNAAIFRFGLLTAMTVVAAVLIDLIILPAFLRVLYPERKEFPQPLDFDRFRSAARVPIARSQKPKREP